MGPVLVVGAKMPEVRVFMGGAWVRGLMRLWEALGWAKGPKTAHWCIPPSVEGHRPQVRRRTNDVKATPGGALVGARHRTGHPGTAILIIRERSPDGGRSLDRPEICERSYARSCDRWCSFGTRVG